MERRGIMDGPNPVNNLLSRGRLADLTRRAREHGDLASSVAQRLPVPVGGHLTLGAYSAGRLTLLADSSVWASKARFMTAQIQTALADLPYPIQEIRIRVAAPGPVRRSPEPASNSARPLTDSVRELLLDTGRTLPEGPIRDALLNLGRSQEDGER